MKKIKKNNDNIIPFKRNLGKLERQIEAILFAAQEPLDIETIEKQFQTTKDIKKILENLKREYD